MDEWRWQLADDAPNHFLINVAAYELDGVKTLVNKRELGNRWLVFDGPRAYYPSE